jgi:hypothetical protein
VSDRLYCPTCGARRTDSTCSNCDYDFVEAATVPVERSPGWKAIVPLAFGIIGLIILAVVALAVLGADGPLGLITG